MYVCVFADFSSCKAHIPHVAQLFQCRKSITSPKNKNFGSEMYGTRVCIHVFATHSIPFSFVFLFYLLLWPSSTPPTQNTVCAEGRVRNSFTETTHEIWSLLVARKGWCTFIMCCYFIQACILCFLI